LLYSYVKYFYDLRNIVSLRVTGVTCDATRYTLVTHVTLVSRLLSQKTVSMLRAMLLFRSRGWLVLCQDFSP